MLCDSSPSGMHSCLPQAFEQFHVRDPQPTVPIEHTFLRVPVLQRLGKRVNKHSPFHWSRLRHSPRFGSLPACVHEHQEEMRPHKPRVSSDSIVNACPAFCSFLPAESMPGVCPSTSLPSGYCRCPQPLGLGKMRLGAALMHSRELGHSSPYPHLLHKVT